MVNLKKFLKPYRQAGAFHALFAPYRFVDEHVFLTKSNQLGVVLRIERIDYECVRQETLETYMRRAAAAWRFFDERFRIYQYVVKQDRAPIEQRSEYPMRQSIEQFGSEMSTCVPSQTGCTRFSCTIRSSSNPRQRRTASCDKPFPIASCCACWRTS
jgi:hypothetical protein